MDSYVFAGLGLESRKVGLAPFSYIIAMWRVPMLPDSDSYFLLDSDSNPEKPDSPHP